MAILQRLWWGEMVKNGLFLGSTLKIENPTENNSTPWFMTYLIEKKKARKNIDYAKNETILKSGKKGHFAKAIIGQKWLKMAYFGEEI